MEQENRNVVGKEEISKLLEEFYIEIRPHINGHKSAINKFFAALDSIKYPKHQPLSPQSDVGVEDAESVLRGHVGAYSIKPPEYYTKAIIAAMQEYASLSLGEKDKIIDKYAISARAIAVWLKDFCNEDLPYDEMISDAARKASKELSTKTAEVEELKERLKEYENNKRDPWDDLGKNLEETTF